MSQPSTPLTPTGKIQQTLRKLIDNDPQRDAPNRNYRLSVSFGVAPNAAQDPMIGIQLESTTQPAVKMAMKILCPRETVESHVLALFREADSHNFILAETKDALRQQTEDFLSLTGSQHPSPPQRPANSVNAPVTAYKAPTKKAAPKPRKLTPPEATSQPLEAPAPTPAAEVSDSKPHTVPRYMKKLHDLLSEVKKPYTLKRISLTTYQDSRKCTVFVGFKLGNGDETSCVASIDNATMESSQHGMIVKADVKQDILATIQSVTKVPSTYLEALANTGTRPRYTPTQQSYTSR